MAGGAAERQRFRAVLLDEFQDTSEAQLVLLRSLFAGQGLAVTAVGDPHQSIYGWRGASATTLTRFPTEFALDGVPAQVLQLTTSWRNDRLILDAANTVAAPLREETAVPVATLRPGPAAAEGAIEVARVLDTVAEAEHVGGLLGRRVTDGDRVGAAHRRRGRRRAAGAAAVVAPAAQPGGAGRGGVPLPGRDRGRARGRGAGAAAAPDGIRLGPA